MTVAELIEKLREMPQELDVCMFSEPCCCGECDNLDTEIVSYVGVAKHGDVEKYVSLT